MIRIQCPECATSYTAERCGLSPRATESVSASVKCSICATVFQVVLVPAVTPAQPWYRRLMRTPVAPVSSHVVKVGS